MDAEYILLKKGWRNDALWTRRFFFSYLRNIPINADTKALMQSQYWPRERMKNYQNARLKMLAEDAVELPFWRDAFSDANLEASNLSGETLSRLPLMTKQGLRRRDFDEYSDLQRYKSSWSDHTSGSTGRPFTFGQDRLHQLRLYGICERMYRTAAPERPHLISMRPRFRRGVLRDTDTFFYIKGYNSVPLRLPELLDEIAKHPEGILLHGFSTVLLHLAHEVHDRKLKLPIKAIVGSAEALTPAQRTFISESLHAPLFMGYVSRELGFLGFECEKGRMHTNDDWAFFEVTDDHGVRLAYGREGHIVITTFDNLVMPFIRWKTGDIGTLSDELCPCGRTLLTVTLRGRDAEFINLGERKVALLEVSGAFDRFSKAVKNFQIVQTEPLSFLVRVVPARQFDARRNEIHSALIRVLHPEAKIEWEKVKEIAEAGGGKAAYFVRVNK